MSTAQTRSTLRRAGPLAIAGLISNGANVIVTILVARLLKASEYGVLAQLIGLFLVLALPGSALVVAVVRRVAAWEQAGMTHRIEPWVRKVRRLGLLALGAFAVVAVASRWWVADHVLNVDDPAGVAEVLTAGVGWGLLAVDRGLLQARRAYSQLARNLVVEGMIRTVLTLGLVAVGMGVEGAALALLGALACADLDARRSLRLLPPATEGPSQTDEEVAVTVGPLVEVQARRKHLVIDAITGLSALGLIAALQNIDIVIVGREAPANRASWAPIATSSKALVFAALVLSGYLLPEAATRWHRGQHALRQLGGALALVAVPASALVFLAALAPRRLLEIVFGSELTGAASAFAPLAMAMSCLAATVLFTHYLLGIGHRRVVGVLAVGLVVTVALLVSADGRKVPTARLDLACQAALAAATGTLVLLSARSAGRTTTG